SRAFFCNSGAEAVEAALKLARKWAQKEKGPECFQIVAAEGSFHGRTFATITATGQAKYREGFGPLLPGVVHARFNDLEDFASKITERTCAVIVEPVQGEVGVRPATAEFLRGLRELCTERGAALIFDEVQTGLGRTGEMFAFQHYGVEPDIIALAKGLGGGVPIGAMLAKEPFASAFGPGDHASTFGGNFLACSAALAVLEVITGEGFLDRVKKVARRLGELLEEMASQLPFVKEARGLGLMRAVEFEPPIARRVEALCRQRGLLLNPIGDRVIRMHPPLIVTEGEVEEAMSILRESAEEAAREVGEG
ncbi:MAG TPA: aminotransferase class III-fold pyridoxal phosphate-dependent enzyme, partial [Armatimonadetes bacterium]|nr:aminotransferase class III-fold pyridoxal phosphate-dependent enzyme [Armatimonadota bacterium]